MSGRTLAVALAAPLLLAACLSDSVQEAAENVVTLQTGTVAQLKALRGTGPFRTYEVEPGEMLVVVERAARRARGIDGLPVSSVHVSERYGEVVAKERDPEVADDDGYSAPFRSAVVATVHPIPGEPRRSRVEIHATNRGPFHPGCVRWECDLPGGIEEELRCRRGS